MKLVEIAIDSIESVKNAIAGGAHRLEVCSSLSEGGLTPTPGLIKFIKSYNEKIPIYAMIRIRPGNFVYSREEMDSMLYDLEVLKNQGVDGFVFGALKEDGSVDLDYCLEVLRAAKPKPVTFHRAFDKAIEPLKLLETLIDLGFERILTSGQGKTAVCGIELLEKLVNEARDRIIIMPGCGINADNIKIVERLTGASEFHASARRRDQQPDEKSTSSIDAIDLDNGIMVADKEMIEKMVSVMKNR